MRSYLLHQFRVYLLYFVCILFLPFSFLWVFLGGLYWYLSWCSPLKALPKDFSFVEVWSLNGPLQHAGPFAFQPFSYRFTAVLWIVVPITQFWPGLSFNRTDGITFKGLVFSGAQSRHTDCMESNSCGCRTSPNNHLSSTLGFLTHMFCILAKYLYFLSPFVTAHYSRGIVFSEANLKLLQTTHSCLVCLSPVLTVDLLTAAWRVWTSALDFIFNFSKPGVSQNC